LLFLNTASKFQPIVWGIITFRRRNLK